jgi:hypothetical protein
VAKEIAVWKARAQPARQQVDGQGKSIHIGEQRKDEGAVGAKAALVPRFAGLKKLYANPTMTMEFRRARPQSP